MNFASSYPAQNWLIVPSPQGIDQPSNPVSEQSFLMTLSGVANVNFKSAENGDWTRETFGLQPDMNSVLQFAIREFGIPVPAVPGSTPSVAFQVSQWAPFTTINSIFDKETAINAGFAVDNFRPAPFSTVQDAKTGQPYNNIFSGIHVDLAVRDKNAFLYRVGYHITLRGKIRFFIPQIL